MIQKYENNYFKFKQFGLHHGFNSFKIGTDAVIMGAWAGQNLNPKNILDIGTGSGVIALMLAQRHPLASVIGIEINSEAAIQAQTNFQESPFSTRLKAVNMDLKEYKSSILFDLIVSNPPFFNNSILPIDETKLRSKHSIKILPEDIFYFSANNLSADGLLSIIYPFDQIEKMVTLANEQGLKLSSILKIHPKLKSEAHRCVMEFTKKETAGIIETHLYIENEERHDFHSSYINLCKDFYLKF